MNYAVMYEFAIDRNSGQFKAPFNTIWNDAQVFTWRDTAIPTPNSDTPYSMCWLDLRAEPVVISVPDVPAGRYFSVQVCDANTYNVGYIGSRATGQGARVLDGRRPGLAGCDAAGREGRDPLHHAIRAGDLPHPALRPDRHAQRRRRAARLPGRSRSRPSCASPRRRAAPEIRWPRVNADLAKHHFFDYLAFALQFNAPQPNEAAIRAQTARPSASTGAARRCRSRFLDRMELLAAAFEGERKVEAAVAAAGVAMNGWRVTPIPGSPEAYNGDWMLRAVAAKAGIYGNSTEEATYPFTRDRRDGRAAGWQRRRATP